jgi:hypothetical protein
MTLLSAARLLTGIVIFPSIICASNLAHYCRELSALRRTDAGYPTPFFLWPALRWTRGVLAPAEGIVTIPKRSLLISRRTIEQAFGCRIYDQYGRGGTWFSGRCEQGHLHVAPDFGYLEVLKADGKPAEPGEMGEVVCTGFLNELQPLIRYQLGDVVRLSRLSHCACGRNMPIIEEICGRVEDMLHTVRGDPVIRLIPPSRRTWLREGRSSSALRTCSSFVSCPIRFSARSGGTLIRNMELLLGRYTYPEEKWRKILARQAASSAPW